MTVQEFIEEHVNFIQPEEGGRFFYGFDELRCPVHMIKAVEDQSHEICCAMNQKQYEILH